MPFRDLLKKKERIQDTGVTGVPDKTTSDQPEKQQLPQATEFKFIRSDTNTQDFINPPHFEGDENEIDPESERPTTPKKRFGRLRALSQNSNKSDSSPPQKDQKRSHRFQLGHKKSESTTSVNLPPDLPEVSDAYTKEGDAQEKEAQWEQRATLLANTSHSRTSSQNNARPTSSERDHSRPRSASDANSDVNIQEAIRLHEAGELEAATRMFHTLADQGNVISQVLFGLSLRHGWGCEPDLDRAVQYLSAAASSSASIESEALKAGIKKGGAAKGELVLAIFELGNCFRHGWGVPVDKAAARQYYETAANLGDTDAMNEAAWCYLEGFGGKKDKFKAAQLLRLAEKNGSKTLGNSWIWKEKYDPK